MSSHVFTTPSGFDVTANRHKGNTQSEAAYDRVKGSLPDERERVLVAIINAGWNGLTAKEYARLAGKQLNQVSGRFSELRAAGMVTVTSERREGSGVVIATERQGRLL